MRGPSRSPISAQILGRGLAAGARPGRVDCSSALLLQKGLPRRAGSGSNRLKLTRCRAYRPREAAPPGQVYRLPTAAAMPQNTPRVHWPQTARACLARESEGQRFRPGSSGLRWARPHVCGQMAVQPRRLLPRAGARRGAAPSLHPTSVPGHALSSRMLPERRGCLRGTAPPHPP